MAAWAVTCAIIVVAVLVKGEIAGCNGSDPTTCADPKTNALTEIAEAVPVLTESIAESTTALDNLRGAVELAIVHRRLSNLELLILSRPTAVVKCPSQDRRKCCCPQCGPAKEETTFDTIGTCVQREKVGKVRFAPGSREPLAGEQAEISCIAKRIQGELRYVFVVGHADEPEFSKQNRLLGEQRAEFVAEALEKLAPAAETESDDHAPDATIRIASGVDWSPTMTGVPDRNGTVGVYLLWHGASPLCNAGRPVSMGTQSPSPCGNTELSG